MQVDALYRLKRGNQNQTVGVIVKGAGASLRLLGSQSLPSSLSEMEDCAEVDLTAGCWGFSMLPEYVYAVGTADSIEIVGMNTTNLNTVLS